jgi:hypothetical protein
MTTAFEELPPAVDTPAGDGRIRWEAVFVAETPTPGLYQQVRVFAVVHQDKASDIRLKQERRGHLMCGMLVDATGMVYGISGVYIGCPAGAEDDSPVLSQVDVARARLVDLASEWRRTGFDCAGAGDPARAVMYAECAQQLDEITVTYLSNQDENHD